MTPSLLRASCLALLLWAPLVNAATIAGTAPDRRPVDAPTVTQQVLDPAALQRSLRGTVAPVPANVVEVARTGAWFVPLRSPGMTGPYDIRGWFSAAPR